MKLIRVISIVVLAASVCACVWSNNWRRVEERTTYDENGKRTLHEKGVEERLSEGELDAIKLPNFR